MGEFGRGPSTDHPEIQALFLLRLASKIICGESNTPTRSSQSRNILFVCFEREREQAGEGQRERGEERESQAGSIHTVSAEPSAGLDLTNCEIMT